MMNLRALKGFTCAITPFNFPIAIGYNLPTVMALCGNTVVWKPSSDAPMTSWMLMKAIEDAGFPPGVINMITGPGLADHAAGAAPSGADLRELHRRLRHGARHRATTSSPRRRRARTSRASSPRPAARTSWCADARMRRLGRGGLHHRRRVRAQRAEVLGQQPRPGRQEGLARSQGRAPRADEVLQDEEPAGAGPDMGPVINRGAFESITGFIERAKKDPQGQDPLAAASTRTRRGSSSSRRSSRSTPTHHELLNVEIFGPVMAVRVCRGRRARPPDHPEQHLPADRRGLVARRGVPGERWVPVLSEYAGQLLREPQDHRRDRGPAALRRRRRVSGTNYKAGGAWYLLQFLSQGTVTRRHVRTIKRPGIWNWM